MKSGNYYVVDFTLFRPGHCITGVNSSANDFVSDDLEYLHGAVWKHLPVAYTGLGLVCTSLAEIPQVGVLPDHH